MTTTRSFRFAVQAQGMGSRDEWVARVYRAEALGYDAWLMADHLDARFAPSVALAVAAEATVSIRLGSFVFANDFRHPVMLAKETATLDVLSGGRFELGIGAGWLRDEYAAAGFPFDPPGVRIDRLAEAIVLLKRLFAPGPVTFTGEHYRVRGLEGEPKPIQRPHPPIAIGGGAPRILTLAAREANIVSINQRSFREANIVSINQRSFREGGLNRADIAEASVARKAAWIREGAGLRWPDLEVNIALAGAALTDDPAGAAAPLAARLGLDVGTVLASPHTLIGSLDAVCDALRERRERFGISYITVPERHMQELAPVVARLRGM